MRIKKVSQTPPTMSSLVGTYSTSENDGYNCKYVNDNYGDVVWVNIQGSSSFPSTTTSVSWGEYKWFRVYFYGDNHLTDMHSDIVNIGGTLNISLSGGNLTRQIQISSSQLYIHSGYYQGGQNNSAIIPSHIIGFK